MTEEKLIRLEDYMLQRERAIALSVWFYIVIFIATAFGFAYIRLLTPFPSHSNILLPLLALVIGLWTWGNTQLTHIQSIKRYRLLLDVNGSSQQCAAPLPRGPAGHSEGAR